MQKSALPGHKAWSGTLLKPLLVMKLAIVIILATALQVQAVPVIGQHLTLNLKQTEVRKVLKSIESEGYYRFLYNSDLKGLRNKVDLSVKNLAITETLDALLPESNLTYKLLDNNVIVILSVNEAANDKIKIIGKITGENGEALSGASVLEKGTGNGVFADNSGSFTITAESQATLIISNIGYESQEINVNGRSVIDVKLKSSVKTADELVIIGYGSASKRDLTGTIAKIGGKDIADKPNTNPIASMQGKVAGLSIVNNGTPGGSPDIRIRGTVSIGQVHPLYVVDGIFNDNIDYLNPNDIESIEVLKDPSSLAIFGVRGATGVIAITTKKAKAGQVVINFNTSYGFKRLVDKIKMADAAQFSTLFAFENANAIPAVATPDYSAFNSNTDWIDAVTRTGKFNTDNLSVSSATDRNRFSLGLGYSTDEGIIIHQKLEKMQLSFSDELKIGKAIKVGVNLNSSRQHNPYDAGAVLDNARKVMPQVSAGTKTFRVANPYGGDSITADIYSRLKESLQTSGVVNPLLEVENTWNKNISIEYRNVGSVYADISFLKYFNWRSTFYADMSHVNSRTYSPLYYAYDPANKDTVTLYGSKTQVSENDQTYRKFQQDHILTFRKNFGPHGLTATAGFTSYYFGNFNRNGVAKPFTTGNALPIPNDKRFWYLSNGFEDPTTSLATSSQGENSSVSVLGRVLYNYKGKYLLNASIRNDASSQIPEKNRNQIFWAVGAAWEISKEKFMENIKPVNYLKLKGSVGVLGNQSTYGVSSNYPSYPNLVNNASAVFGTYIYNAAVPAYEVNPDLKWETVHAKEIGVELVALNNRLHFEANYFNRTTKDLMTYISLGSLGLKDKLTNGGSIRNMGEEFTASWTQKLNRDFTINVGGNITFLKNKVLTLSPDLPGGAIILGSQNNGSAESRTTPGEPIGAFYGYVVEGLYQSYADILASPVASALGSYRPGDFKFKDVNGDGKITADDRTVIGNPTPKFTYGANINLNYKNVSLAIDMGGVYGNQIFRTWGSLESPFQRVNYAAFKANSWTGPGTSNWDPIVGQGDRFNYNGSSYNIEDGSYFRLRNIQLGYNFNQRLISKARIKNLRLFANMQNLKTWKNNYGYTAEYGGSAVQFGYDNAGNAIPAITTFGLNVTF
jgi:TonB-linked SusC/RagA family outer membrane protein